MITIDRLDIQFDVEAGDEQETFRRLFNQTMQQWRQREVEEERLRRMIDHDRELGDRMSAGKR